LGGPYREHDFRISQGTLNLFAPLLSGLDDAVEPDTTLQTGQSIRQLCRHSLILLAIRKKDLWHLSVSLMLAELDCVNLPPVKWRPSPPTVITSIPLVAANLEAPSIL
jgi:hypothetical protein